jgi:hypothetical protein
MMRRAHLPILTLLAAALFLRALIPVGWMPVEGSASFSIQPCPAADLSAPGGHHHHPSQHGQHDGDCAFAPFHAGFAPASDFPALQVPEPASAKPSAHFLISAFPTGPPAPPPPARGPPTIA